MPVRMGGALGVPCCPLTNKDVNDRAGDVLWHRNRGAQAYIGLQMRCVVEERRASPVRTLLAHLASWTTQ